jgi:NADPH-dependent 2,4-dienoyl-CoA reductase/sulfur reductase-like enzyme
VAVHTGCRVDRIEKTGGRLTVVCDGLALPADLVLVAVGVTPNNRLAKQAGIALGAEKAIAVNRRMQTSAPDVYAAGDCADAFHVVTGERVWIPLALRANRAGWAAADNVTGRAAELPGVAGTAVFRTFEMEVARTGLTLSEAQAAGFQPAAVTIKARSRAHAHPGARTIHVHMVADTVSGRLLGAQMVGPEGVAHRINAPAVALHAGMTVDEFSQSDLAYAPPFGPTWDPMLTAANQLLKKL